MRSPTRSDCTAPSKAACTGERISRWPITSSRSSTSPISLRPVPRHFPISAWIVHAEPTRNDSSNPLKQKEEKIGWWRGYGTLTHARIAHETDESRARALANAGNENSPERLHPRCWQGVASVQVKEDPSDYHLCSREEPVNDVRIKERRSLSQVGRSTTQHSLTRSRQTHCTLPSREEDVVNSRGQQDECTVGGDAKRGNRRHTIWSQCRFQQLSACRINSSGGLHVCFRKSSQTLSRCSLHSVLSRVYSSSDLDPAQCNTTR
jgi:hypothetical protein